MAQCFLIKMPNIDIGVLHLLIQVSVTWLGNMAYYGIRNRQQGAAGGVLALAVFAVSSYPLQLPSFWGGVGVFGGDMRDGRWDADKIICPIRITGVPYYDDKSVVACLRLSVHLAERAI